MKITIEIPEEFESHFYKDKFFESFDRIINDIEYRLDNEDTFLAGNYEKEIIEMLQKAFSEYETPEVPFPSECCGTCTYFNKVCFNRKSPHLGEEMDLNYEFCPHWAEIV